MNYWVFLFSLLWKSFFKDWNCLHFECFVDLRSETFWICCFLHGKNMKYWFCVFTVKGPLRFCLLSRFWLFRFFFPKTFFISPNISNILASFFSWILRYVTLLWFISPPLSSLPLSFPSWRISSLTSLLPSVSLLLQSVLHNHRFTSLLNKDKHWLHGLLTRPPHPPLQDPANDCLPPLLSLLQLYREPHSVLSKFLPTVSLWWYKNSKETKLLPLHLHAWFSFCCEEFWSSSSSVSSF